MLLVKCVEEVFNHVGILRVLTVSGIILLDDVVQLRRSFGSACAVIAWIPFTASRSNGGVAKNVV